MICCAPDPTIHELLADPLTQAVMKADRVEPGHLEIMLLATAGDIAKHQKPRERSIIGQLIGMLAAYYGTALCRCMRPDTQFQICKA
jgi:hypothetical protein